MLVQLPKLKLRGQFSVQVPEFTDDDLAEIARRTYCSMDRDLLAVLGEVNRLRAVRDGHEQVCQDSCLSDVDYLLIRGRAGEESVSQQYRTDVYRLLYEVDRLRGELGVEAGVSMRS